jgi:hypothetical protein
MQVLLDLDRLDGVCDLRRVATDGAGQDYLAPGALVCFEPVAAGGQDRDVAGLPSPHTDRRQRVHVAAFDRRYDALDNILVDRKTIGMNPNRGRPSRTPVRPTIHDRRALANFRFKAIERLHGGRFGLACRTRERLASFQLAGGTGRLGILISFIRHTRRCLYSTEGSASCG